MGGRGQIELPVSNGLISSVVTALNLKKKDSKVDLQRLRGCQPRGEGEVHA